MLRRNGSQFGSVAIGELEWRLQEVERRQRVRASLLPAPEYAVIVDLMARLKGVPAEATAAAS